MRFREKTVIFFMAIHVTAMFEVTSPQLNDFWEIDSDDFYPQTCLQESAGDVECSGLSSGTLFEKEFQGTILSDTCELDCEDEDSCYLEGLPVFYMPEPLETDEAEVIIETSDDIDTTIETSKIVSIVVPTSTSIEDPTTTTTTISLTEVQAFADAVTPRTPTIEASVIDHRTSSTSEAPTSSTTEAPTSSTTEASTSSTTEAPTSSTTEAPMSSTTKASTTVTREAPTSSTSEALTSSTTEVSITVISEASKSSTSKAPNVEAKVVIIETES